MCIFLASTEHPDFPFVLLDNRDEYFDRPTAPAHWWEDSPDIFGPQDLRRSEKGTWIGVSRKGRVAVLVNYFEEKGPNKSKISRGVLPKLFLASQLSPVEWVEDIKKRHKEEMQNSGGFTVLVAQIKTNPDHQPEIEIEFLSNEHIQLPPKTRTVALSNGSITDASWTKTSKAKELFSPLIRIENPADLISEALQVLSFTQDSPPSNRQELRKHVFIPPLTAPESPVYGTRTQTVILVDKSGHVHYAERDVKTKNRAVEEFDIAVK